MQWLVNMALDFSVYYMPEILSTQIHLWQVEKISHGRKNNCILTVSNMVPKYAVMKYLVHRICIPFVKKLCYDIHWPFIKQLLQTNPLFVLFVDKYSFK